MREPKITTREAVFWRDTPDQPWQGCLSSTDQRVQGATLERALNQARALCLSTLDEPKVMQPEFVERRLEVMQLHEGLVRPLRRYLQHAERQGSAVWVCFTIPRPPGSAGEFMTYANASRADLPPPG